ncbi:hypothetical protein [Streptomyces profundus]|uniref:hypothetical protein n=1 Tax=Streptomyces profundus TaxID=2867410 RepID=UPI001D16C994|nr:hypothetical protein [Streptomyces sp. MA3_2.13]UED86326.1 hypothetical protein K4G22_20765 [Streptomyces sp. MA3_2.13]
MSHPGSNPMMASPTEDWEFLTPAPGDGNGAWVRGPCWFFCEHRITAVLWLGCVTTVGASAAMYACWPCLERLHAMVWDTAEASRDAPVDGTGRLVPLYRPLGAGGPPEPLRYRCRDPRPRTSFGARLSRLVTRPGDPTTTYPSKGDQRDE